MHFIIIQRIIRDQGVMRSLAALGNPVQFLGVNEEYNENCAYKKKSMRRRRQENGE